jgi:hypothetical protein
MTLSDKERLFCKTWLSNGNNGVQAALNVGISSGNARTWAYRTLKKAYIQNFLNREIKKMEDKLDITFEKKLALLWKCATRCSNEDEQGEFIPNSLINAVAELNKMQGHYKQKETTEDKIDEMKQKLDELADQYKRDY